LNTAPNNSTLISPEDGATGVSTSPVLNVTVTDEDLDEMNVSFYRDWTDSLPLNAELTRAGANVQSVYADSDYIYSGGRDTNVQVYYKNNLSIKQNLTQAEDWVSSVYADSDYVYVGGWDYKVQVYYKNNLSIKQNLTQAGSVVYSVYADDDYIYAGGYDDKVQVYYRNNLSIKQNLTQAGNNILSIYADDDYIYAGGSDDKVQVYYKNNLSFNIELTHGGVNYVQTVYADSDYIYAGGNDNKVQVYYKNNLSFNTELTHAGDFVLSIYTDSDYIYAGGSDDKVQVYYKNNLSIKQNLTEAGNNILSIYTDSDYIYAGGSDYKVQVYYKRELLYNDPSGVSNGSSVNYTWGGLAAHTTYKWFATANDGEETTTSDTWSFTTVNSLPSITLNNPLDGATGISLSPVLNVTVTDVDLDGMNVSFYRLGSMADEFIIKQNLTEAGDNVNSVYTDSDYIYAGGNDDKVQVYYRNNLSLKTELTQAGSNVRSVYTDSDYIYAGGDDDKVQIYYKSNFTTKTELIRAGSNILSIYSDSDYIYSGGLDTKVQVYYKNNLSLKTELIQAGSNILSIYSDSDYIYAGGSDTNIQVYYRNNLSLKMELMQATDWVYSVYADSDYIYAGGYDDKVQVYYKNNFSINKNLTQGGGAIRSVYADSDYIYAGGSDTNVQVYYKNNLSFKQILSESGLSVNSVYADSDYIYSGGMDDKVQVYYKRELLYNQTSASNGSDVNYTWSGLNGNTLYKWQADVTDGYDTKTSDVWNFTTSASDSNPPEVAIISPLNQNYSTSSIWFNISANDSLSEMGSCWYNLNYGNNITMSNSSDIYYSQNTSVPDGSYTAYFFCNDSNGLLNDSESVSFEVDATGPVISNARINSSSPVFINTIVKVNASVVDSEGNLDTVSLEIIPPASSAYNTTLTQNGNEFYNNTLELNESGNWQFRFYANDSFGNSATPVLAQDSDSNNYISVQSYGSLNVVLVSPTGITNTQPQNQTFNLKANVSCLGQNSICGNVNGTVRYNLSSSLPDTDIQGGDVSDTPFYTIELNPQSCGNLNSSNSPCSLNWDINTTGDLGERYKLDVNFSSDSEIISNKTNYTLIKIVSPIISITLSNGLADVSFGDSLTPGTEDNPALNNSENAYNLTCLHPGGNCNISIRGNSNLKSGINEISIGNISWNKINDTLTESPLSLMYNTINSSLPDSEKQFVYFWLDLPNDLVAGNYKSNFTIYAESS
ncbi:hypothetical protein K9L16_02830, partial [Candidatus Pacearchaeota archaeon]|nr:hypothetical protein [Candidatus Pacearchaeota archaeon]